MGDNNFYEDAASEVAAWLPGIVKAAASEVRGGKSPPWTRELKGRQLLDFYRDADVAAKQKLWPELSDEEKAMLKGAYGTGGRG